MIEVRGLVKQYGAKIAVNDLSFDVEPGHVTGFLGPNGAGKTTTMRLILGLDYPDAGTVSVDGQRYSGLANPMREVGALLDAKAVHGGRSAYNHLLCLAQTNNLPKRRVGEVLELVGLTEVARKRTTAPPPDQSDAPPAQPAQTAQPAPQSAQQQSPPAFPAPLPSGTFTR